MSVLGQDHPISLPLLELSASFDSQCDFFFFEDFIYLFMRDIDREVET